MKRSFTYGNQVKRSFTYGSGLQAAEMSDTLKGSQLLDLQYDYGGATPTQGSAAASQSSAK